MSRTLRPFFNPKGERGTGRGERVLHVRCRRSGVNPEVHVTFRVGSLRQRRGQGDQGVKVVEKYRERFR